MVMLRLRSVRLNDLPTRLRGSAILAGLATQRAAGRTHAGQLFSRLGVCAIHPHRQKVAAGWLLTKDPFRIGYGLLTGALVIGAICFASPSHSRNGGLHLIWR